jgi:hypothetical protein
VVLPPPGLRSAVAVGWVGGLPVELVELFLEPARLGRSVVVGSLDLVAQLGPLVGVELAAAGDAVGDRAAQDTAVSLRARLAGAGVHEPASGAREGGEGDGPPPRGGVVVPLGGAAAERVSAARGGMEHGG